MTLKEETIPTTALYGLLASVFLAEIGPELLTRLRSPEFQQIFEELDVNLGEEFYRVEQEPLLEALAVEYSGLFIGPGHFISPHESVHHVREDGDYGKLWGADTVAVKKFIEATGLSYDQQFTGMPDHVGAELEFVQKLLEASHEATQKHDAELAGNLLGIKNRFLAEHLLAWAPAFFEKVMGRASLPFYREMAALARDFLDREQAMLDQEEQCKAP